MSKVQMRDLARIAAVLRDRELAQVERILNHRQRLESDLARLEAMRAEQLASATFDPARMAGADLVWDTWCEERMTDTRQRLALLRAEHEVALDAARTAFGRADVMSRLAEDQKP